MSYLKKGGDTSDRIQIEGYYNRKSKENDATKKIRKRVQEDEQTRINHYSEGYCYGCSKVDKMLSTLVYVCSSCMEKRGVEGLMCIITRKHNYELCDICGNWEFDNVSQINISFCDSCMRRMLRIHRAYRKKGGKENAPDAVRKRKYYGKDFNEILGNGITRDQTKNQAFTT